MFLFFFFSETDESCKKHLGRVLSIWEERSVYENDVLEQLKQALCKYIVFYYNLFIKMYSFFLAVVAQWIECLLANQRVAGSIPSQGTCLGCVSGPWLGVYKRHPQIAVSLPLFYPPFSSLKINKIFKKRKKIVGLIPSRLWVQSQLGCVRQATSWCTSPRCSLSLKSINICLGLDFKNTFFH